MSPQLHLYTADKTNSQNNHQFTWLRAWCVWCEEEWHKVEGLAVSNPGW